VKVLLTNDDGIQATGLNALRRALLEVPSVELAVIAPDANRSASARSITTRTPLWVEEIEFGDGTTGFATDGTPVDCVRFAALGLLGFEPELIVSGINHGANLGDDITYSGTVAAAMEGTLHRRSAIPDPTLGVVYTRDHYEAAGNQPYTIGLAASIPLPFFDHGQYQARAADHRAEELGAVLQSTERHAASDARSLLIRRRLLQQKLENIQNTALPRSNEVVGSTTTAYERGQISLTDLLIARREHAALELEEADTRFMLFSVENELRRALGIDQNLVGQKPREDS